MKMNIVIDCTPDEARTFFGLPDVKPLQQRALARLEKRIDEATEAMSPEGLLRAWFSLMPQAQEQYRDWFINMFKPPLTAGEKKRESK